MKKHLKKTFLTGLFILIPLVVTIYIIYTVVISVDTFISPFIRNIMANITGTSVYIKGTGFFLFIIITYLTGVLASNYIGKKLLTYGEATIRKIPFVKGIYGSIKDMIDAFSSEKMKSFKEVVLIDFPFKGRYAIGFITQRIQSGDKGELCAVFVPTTPNPTSGYLIFLPEEDLIHMDMSVEDAVKYVVSLGTSRVEMKWKEKKSSTF
ncbi:MAG: DUF502 domain-containing protein [Proteobacteria bacterium]|nr:DUF502 domain-containing protein [Pseudomonadota bacterium]